MRKLWMLGLAVLLTPALAAQQRDSARVRGDTAEAQRLRAQIEQRFSQHVQQELNLTSDQSTKLRASQEKYGSRRRALMEQQRERHEALRDQMQPGVAANQDSVSKLLEGIRSGRAEMFKLEQDEDREMSGYLNPVQRARYLQMRQHFMERVNEMRQQRRGKGPGRMGPGRRGPGMGTEARPRGPGVGRGIRF